MTTETETCGENVSDSSSKTYPKTEKQIKGANSVEPCPSSQN